MRTPSSIDMVGVEIRGEHELLPVIQEHLAVEAGHLQ